MVKLNELNEPTILHNLRARYKRGDIYTYVRGTLLPFPTLPLPTPLPMLQPCIMPVQAGLHVRADDVCIRYIPYLTPVVHLLPSLLPCVYPRYVGTILIAVNPFRLLPLYTLLCLIKTLSDTGSSTAGVSLVMRGQEVVQQLQQAFDRDWDSKFAAALP